MAFAAARVAGHLSTSAGVLIIWVALIAQLRARAHFHEPISVGNFALLTVAIASLACLYGRTYTLLGAALPTVLVLAVPFAGAESELFADGVGAGDWSLLAFAGYSGHSMGLLVSALYPSLIWHDFRSGLPRSTWRRAALLLFEQRLFEVAARSAHEHGEAQLAIGRSAADVLEAERTCRHRRATVATQAGTTLQSIYDLLTTAQTTPPTHIQYSYACRPVGRRTSALPRASTLYSIARYDSSHLTAAVPIERVEKRVEAMQIRAENLRVRGKRDRKFVRIRPAHSPPSMRERAQACLTAHRAGTAHTPRG